MSKTILAASVCAAALLCASGAFAGSTDSQSNTAQSGYDNQAYIDQTGTNNWVGGGPGGAFAQTDTGAVGNTLNVHQSGTSNVVGYSKSAYQSGTGNQADIHQSNNNTLAGGQLDTVNIQQTGDGNGSIGGMTTATVPAPVAGALPGLGANAQTDYIGQSGTNQLVDLYQNGHENVFNLTQSGSGNQTLIQQWGEHNGAMTRQSASDSVINLYQDQTTGGGAYQPGFYIGNYAYASQSSGSGDNIGSTQKGAGNVFVGTQTGVGTNKITNTQSGNQDLLGARNAAYIAQNGDNNTFSNSQSGTNQRVEGLGGDLSAATQNNSYNQATSTQTGDGQLLALYQSGDNNHLLNTQSGAGNTLTATQEQSDDTVGDTMYIGGNQLTNLQDGTNAVATVTQSGSGNLVNTHQSWDHQVASITQSGALNMAYNTQGGGNSNQLMASQSGYNNNITNVQSGSSNIVHVNQH